MHLTPQAPTGQTFQEAMATPAPALRDYEEFTLPPQVPLHERKIRIGTESYALITIYFVLTNIEEEKKAYARAGMNPNPVLLAMHKTTEALRIVRVTPIETMLNAAGERVETFDADPASKNALEFRLSTHDGSVEGVFASMHPGMRDLVMLGFGMCTSVDEGHAALFAKSRRTIAR